MSNIKQINKKQYSQGMRYLKRLIDQANAESNFSILQVGNLYGYYKLNEKEFPSAISKDFEFMFNVLTHEQEPLLSYKMFWKLGEMASKYFNVVFDIKE